MKERLAIVLGLPGDDADKIEFYDYEYVYDPFEDYSVDERSIAKALCGAR